MFERLGARCCKRVRSPAKAWLRLQGTTRHQAERCARRLREPPALIGACVPMLPPTSAVRVKSSGVEHTAVSIGAFCRCSRPCAVPCGQKASADSATHQPCSGRARTATTRWRNCKSTWRSAARAARCPDDERCAPAIPQLPTPQLTLGPRTRPLSGAASATALMLSWPASACATAGRPWGPAAARLPAPLAHCVYVSLSPLDSSLSLMCHRCEEAREAAARRRG